MDVVHVLKVATSTSFNFSELDTASYVSLPNIYKMAMLTSEDREFSLASYKTMYPSKSFDLSNLGEVIRKYNYVVMFGEVFGN